MTGKSRYVLPAVAGIVAALAGFALERLGVHLLLWRVVIVGVAIALAMMLYRKWSARA